MDIEFVFTFSNPHFRELGLSGKLILEGICAFVVEDLI